MEPAIHTGSVVVVLPFSELKVGDVITFKGNTGMLDSITHRIVKIGSDGIATVFTTKGDANNANDTNVVYPENVIGKVLFSVPYFGYAVAAVKTKYGFLAIIITPAALIILDEMKKLYDELKKKKCCAVQSKDEINSNK
jgi:signal peptidase